jgi:hypothetical protein
MPQHLRLLAAEDEDGSSQDSVEGPHHQSDVEVEQRHKSGVEEREDDHDGAPGEHEGQGIEEDLEDSLLEDSVEIRHARVVGLATELPLGVIVIVGPAEEEGHQDDTAPNKALEGDIDPEPQLRASAVVEETPGVATESVNHSKSGARGKRDKRTSQRERPCGEVKVMNRDQRLAKDEAIELIGQQDGPDPICTKEKPGPEGLEATQPSVS